MAIYKLNDYRQILEILYVCIPSYVLIGKDIINQVLFKSKLSTNLNIDIWHAASLTLDLVINNFHRRPKETY